MPPCGRTPIWEMKNAVNVHISRLRAKVEDAPKAPRLICTVWGIGYKWGVDA